MNRSLDIDAADATIDAHVLTPDNTDGRLPGVLLLTDIGGLRPCYFEKAQHIANGGYAVLMPNLYYRDTRGVIVPEGQSFRDDNIRPTLMEYAGHLTPDAQLRDFDALLRSMDNEPEFAGGGIAVVGYCMTGGFALRMAAQRPDRVMAAAGFHPARLAVDGDPDSPALVADRIAARVYLGYADHDALMPPADIARMDGALARAGVDFIAELYKDAEHGYTAKDAPAYDVDADTRHYRRLFTLLSETIG